MASEIINNLRFHFDKGFEVKGRLTISDLIPKSQERCGIYLLQFSNSTFYIGQAKDVVSRFSQHAKGFSNIENIWFQAVSKNMLDEVEQKLIVQAEEEGLLLTNKTFVSNVIGKTDLDDLITSDDQEEWIENGKNIDDESYSFYKLVDYKHIIKYRANFEKLKADPCYELVSSVLKLYITQCLPAYRKTEQTFWSLSCLSSTNSGTYPRYFCLSVNAMEVFVMGFERKTNIPFAFFICSTLFYESEETIKDYLDQYKSLELKLSDYRAAGEDQVMFHFTDMNDLLRILQDDLDIIYSIQDLNLRLMRKGGTIYSPYHCFDLVNEIVGDKVIRLDNNSAPI